MKKSIPLSASQRCNELLVQKQRPGQHKEDGKFGEDQPGVSEGFQQTKASSSMVCRGQTRNFTPRNMDSRTNRPPHQYSGARPKHRPRVGQPMELETLTELANGHPRDALMSLISNNTGFDVLLNTPTLDSHIVEKILKVSAFALTTQHMPANVSCLLRMLNESHFFEKHVSAYLTGQVIQSSVSPDNLINIISVRQKTLHHLPSSSAASVTITISQLQMLVAKDETNSCSSVTELLDRLVENHKDVMEQMRIGRISKNSINEKDEDNMKPPDNFRSIQIIPTGSEIVRDEESFLRKNKIFGGYQSVEHYLDVQFRLLREDFLAPLRDGIQSYLRMKKEKRGKTNQLADIRVYTNVHIEYPVLTKSGTVHTVRFDVAPFKRVRWETSKRLIFGSLVCLSQDNFTTLIFGTVAERTTKGLEDGKIFIKFEDSSLHLVSMDFSTEYEMVESTSYFEAYRYNLEGLQEITEKDLPFKKYLLHCDTNVDAPRYIRGRGAEYNFKSVLERSSSVPILQRRVEVLDRGTWPTATQLGLDNSQYQALQTALTKEFSIIQGPPGTGKTFLGLKIMQLLLENRAAWNRDGNCPILVVCYTNHALDQFLEGTLELTNLCTDELLRIGGRSQSSVMEQCNIRNHRDRKHRSERVQQVLAQMENISAIVTEQMGNVISAWSSVLHERYLESVMIPNHYACLMREQTSNASIVYIWLMHGSDWTVEENSTELVDIEEQEKEDDAQEIIDIENDRQLNEPETITDTYERSMRAHSAKKHEHAVYGIDPYNEDNGGDFEIHRRKRTKKKNDQALLIHHLSNRKYDIMSEKEELKYPNLWSLDTNSKWRLYKLWLTRLCGEYVNRIHMLGLRHSNLATQLKELNEMGDIEIIRGATVIGMTTTGAAKNRRVLQQVKPRIVIVEEAAEVFESHIVTTLSENCQHLILIGDHQQLRPNPAAYKLAKNYNLDISLFERMVKNSTHCDKLLVQHRMRPEIARLIVPHVYKVLHNHPSVEKYENVKGVQGNLFFIEHHETETAVDDLRSRSNKHEAEYLVALARYFLQQGYEGSRLTILTSYTGQMFLIKQLMRLDEIFENQAIRVTPVDNYQGEENDIVMLSLVRSNQEGQIGFLKISNRVCVALSRARMGFYAIGNMSLLEESSSLWMKICKDMKNEGKVLDALPLACQNHPEVVVLAKKASDFQKAPDGGCMVKCDFRLDCGHVCILRCHPYDMEHAEYRCEKPCNKVICDQGHGCPQRCCEDCPPCTILMRKTIPKCGHTQMVPCSTKPSAFKCGEPCEKLLRCGHCCKENCGAGKCTSDCKEVVPDRKWPCGHLLSLACYRKPESFPCQAKVDRLLHCGHTVEVQCSANIETTLCREIVDITCENGHASKLQCHFSKEAKCYAAVQNICPRKHKYNTRCSDGKSGLCSHVCSDVLKCGHDCKGKCGECREACQHAICRYACRETLICGHKCTGLCGLPCPPCPKSCLKNCGHSPCKHNCGLSDCWQCRKPCTWRCKHHSCDRQCWEPCIRPPCNKLCRMQIVQCGHECVGLCGEVCPHLCRICHRENFEMTSRTLKIPIRENSRYVVIEPCWHVIDVQFMDDYMKNILSPGPNGPTVLRQPTCPVCLATISNCNRYNRLLKQFAQDFQVVKAKTREAYQKNVVEVDNLPKPMGAFLSKEYLSKPLSDITDDVHGAVGVVRLFAACSSRNTTLTSKLRSKWIANHTEPLNPEVMKIQIENAVREGKFGELKGMLPHLMLMYILCHIRMMLTFTKNQVRVSRLKNCNAEITNLLSSPREDATKLYQRFCDYNRMIRDNFDVRSRNGVENFLVDVAGCFSSKKVDLTKKKWIKCNRGHVFSVDKCESTADSQCSSCHCQVEEDRHTWLDDLHDDLERRVDGSPPPAQIRERRGEGLMERLLEQRQRQRLLRERIRQLVISSDSEEEIDDDIY